MAGSGRKREKLWNIVQYFAIEKMQRGGSQQIQGGNQNKRVQEAGGLNLLVPPPPLKPTLRPPPCTGETNLQGKFYVYMLIYLRNKLKTDLGFGQICGSWKLVGILEMSQKNIFALLFNFQVCENVKISSRYF